MGDNGAGPVIVVAATNRPDVLDNALLRPGRFDRHVRVGLPNEEGRLEILRVHVQGRQGRRVPLADDVNLEETAQQTFAFSGADLANVVNEAALLAMRVGRQSVSAAEFKSAVEKVRCMN